jgi:two-component system NtrC family sensor kinase
MKAARRRAPLNVNAKRVLAIDDEEVMGYVIQKIVRHLGYDVEWVTSCETALEKIQNERYDAILSDFRMPAMSGERFYEAVALLGQNFLKKLIFITGDASSSGALGFFRKVDVPFLLKPFKIEELERILRKVADN